MTDRELLELIANQVSTLTTQTNGITAQVNGLAKDVSELKEGQHKIEKTVMKIEQEHGKKLEALFDGYKQNAEKLDQIKTEVKKHDEFILKRVK